MDEGCQLFLGNRCYSALAILVGYLLPFWGDLSIHDQNFPTLLVERNFSCKSVPNPYMMYEKVRSPGVLGIFIRRVGRCEMSGRYGEREVGKGFGR